MPFADAGQGPGPFSIVSVTGGKALHLDAQGLLAQTVPTGGADQQWLATIREFATGIDAESAWLFQHQATELALTLTSAAAGSNISAQLDNGGVDRTQAWWGGLVWRAGSFPAVCTFEPLASSAREMTGDHVRWRLPGRRPRIPLARPGPPRLREGT